MRRRWRGEEIVMDAGSGSGGLTRVLASKVPGGHVYAVDSDANMAKVARATLADSSNVTVIRSKFEKVKLPRKVVVVFSNAALHWVPDHERVFSNFWKLLRTDGELLIQCGGEGNLASALGVINRRVLPLPEFGRYFAGWKAPLYFANPDDTEEILTKIGFRNISASLSKEPTKFKSRGAFAQFVNTVVIRPYTGRLPTHALRNRFLHAFLDAYWKESESGWLLDYVRLNITAKKSERSSH
jgi:trans-aconitate methyltransferase